MTMIRSSSSISIPNNKRSKVSSGWFVTPYIYQFALPPNSIWFPSFVCTSSSIMISSVYTSTSPNRIPALHVAHRCHIYTPAIEESISGRKLPRSIDRRNDCFKSRWKSVLEIALVSPFSRNRSSSSTRMTKPRCGPNKILASQRQLWTWAARPIQASPTD